MNEPEIIQDIFENAKTIAIVGISNKPDRPSYRIAAEMQKRGYKIIPVNPVLKEVLGEPVYP
ncbi:MAG TPA: CoA-binding protein, partial [Acidobacteriaceae bacterium]|nr:CoA-binding protein [Acidobacteriaceae bacterium]